MINSRIKDLNKDEKPREKIIASGPANLTSTELLALILNTGYKGCSAINISREILNNTGSINALSKMSYQTLISYKGVSEAKACTLLAAFELCTRALMNIQESKIKIEKPVDVYNYLRKDFFDQSKELLILVSINSRNVVIAKDVISVGSLNETIVSPREIFSKALARNAACIILAHNHPSNDITPSAEDLKVTEKIASIGLEMNIPLLDHIIVSNTEFASLKQLNLFSINKKGGEEHD